MWPCSQAGGADTMWATATRRTRNRSGIRGPYFFVSALPAAGEGATWKVGRRGGGDTGRLSVERAPRGVVRLSTPIVAIPAAIRNVGRLSPSAWIGWN